MKKQLLYILIVLLGFTPCMAQNQQNRQWQRHQHEQKDRRNDNNKGQRRFNPEDYQKRLEAHITVFAGLTPQEAQAFFPLFREMQQKQRAIFMKQKKMDKTTFTDDKAALEALTLHDNAELEIKKLQQNYHKRFLKVLPATKVLKSIMAEDHFNRDMMRGFAVRPPMGKPKK